MTPRRHRTVALEARPWVPVEVAYDDSFIYLGAPASEWDAWDADAALDDFCRLASAQPEEMAAFVAATAVPELCQHGELRWHTGRKGADPCPMLEEDGVPVLLVGQLRSAARGLAAVRSIGAELRNRRPGEHSAWTDLLHWTGVHPPDRQAIVEGDWARQRPILADLMEMLLRDAGVGPVFTWEDRTSLTLSAREPLGAMVLMAARELGNRSAYTCDNCGSEVTPARPPRPGEGVYCDRAACKKARDAAASRRYRQRKREAEGSAR